jgi:hypothetical protein
MYTDFHRVGFENYLIGRLKDLYERKCLYWRSSSMAVDNAVINETY